MSHKETYRKTLLRIPVGRFGQAEVWTAHTIDVLDPQELKDDHGNDPNYPFKWPDNDPNLIRAQAIAAWTEMMRPREEHPISAYESPLTISFGNIDTIWEKVRKESKDSRTTPVYKSEDAPIRDISIKTYPDGKAIDTIDISFYVPALTKSICEKETDRALFQTVLREYVDPTLQISHTIAYGNEGIEGDTYEKMLVAFPRSTFKSKSHITPMKYFLYDTDTKNKDTFESSMRNALAMGRIYVTELYKSNDVDLPTQNIQIGKLTETADPKKYFPVL